MDVRTLTGDAARLNHMCKIIKWKEFNLPVGRPVLLSEVLSALNSFDEVEWHYTHEEVVQSLQDLEKSGAIRLGLSPDRPDRPLD
jgi:hypothetical protein